MYTGVFGVLFEQLLLKRPTLKLGLLSVDYRYQSGTVGVGLAQFVARCVFLVGGT